MERYLPGLALMFFAVIAWRKGWHLTGLLFAFIGFLGALLTQTWVQNLIQAQAATQWPSSPPAEIASEPAPRELPRDMPQPPAPPEPMYGDEPPAETADAEAEEQEERERRAEYVRLLMIEDDLLKATQELTKVVTEQQSQLDAQAQQLESIKAALAGQQDTWESLKTDLGKAQQQIQRHQEQLGGVASFVQDVSQVSKKSEDFALKDKDRLTYLPQSDEEAFIYFKLADVPRPETLAIQWDTLTPAPEAYTIHKNIIRLRVTGNLKKLMKRPFVVRYVPDTSRANDHARMFVQNREVYVDGERFTDIVAQAAGPR
jgi:hypothetical protein